MYINLETSTDDVNYYSVLQLLTNYMSGCVVSKMALILSATLLAT